MEIACLRLLFMPSIKLQSQPNSVNIYKLCLVDLTRSLLDRVTNLRSAMVQEWLENSEEYEPFMSLSDAKFEDIGLTYKTPGSFSGACGNLMVMALANVLKINIVLFTSMEQMPVIPVIPRDALLTPHPIYIAFNIHVEVVVIMMRLILFHVSQMKKIVVPWVCLFQM